MVARNSIDVSLFSDTGSALAASVPAQPSAPTKNSADSSQIVIQWIAPDDRGSIVTNNQVFWDYGTGATFRTLITTTSNSVFEASSTFAEADPIDGKVYKIAIRAVNAIGPSTYSASVSVIAATAPGTPDAPSVTTASSADI